MSKPSSSLAGADWRVATWHAERNRNGPGNAAERWGHPCPDGSSRRALPAAVRPDRPGFGYAAGSPGSPAPCPERSTAVFHQRIGTTSPRVLEPGQARWRKLDIEFLSKTFGPVRPRSISRHPPEGSDEPMEPRQPASTSNPRMSSNVWGLRLLQNRVVWHVDGGQLGRLEADRNPLPSTGYRVFPPTSLDQDLCRRSAERTPTTSSIGSASIRANPPPPRSKLTSPNYPRTVRGPQASPSTTASAIRSKHP